MLHARFVHQLAHAKQDKNQLVCQANSNKIVKDVVNMKLFSVLVDKTKHLIMVMLGSLAYLSVL